MSLGRGRLRCRVIWTQWALPLTIWWWPVAKDRALGVHVGPVHLMWTRERGEL